MADRQHQVIQSAAVGDVSAVLTTGQPDPAPQHGQVSDLRIVAEYQEGKPCSVKVSGRIAFGTQGKRTSVTLAVPKGEGVSNLQALLSEMLVEQSSRLYRRLMRDAGTAYEHAIRNGVEPDEAAEEAE